jgi:hypothetical protein
METTETSPQNSPLDPSLTAAGHDGRESGEVSGLPDPKRVLAPWWVRIVPFFLSAFFFLSALFAVFAPLPLLLLRFRSGRAWMWGAILTNSAIVGLAAGRISLAIYGVFVVALVLAMGGFIASRRSLERTAVLTLLMMALCGGLLVGWYSHLHHINPVQEVRQEISATVDYLQQSVSQGNVMNSADMDEWKQNLLLEFPSALAVFALVMIWTNLATLLRVNPGGIRERMGLDASFFKKWKSPDWLVWPTIVTGFFLIVDVGKVSSVSINVFRFLMAVYAIQGLSILSFIFDVWNVRGFFRALGFLAAIFLMMPLLLSLGFFDLWFDFRSKFRQS